MAPQSNRVSLSPPALPQDHILLTCLILIIHPSSRASSFLPVEAATKIQAVFRGHKVRATKTMKPGDDESPTKDAAASSGAAGNDESSGAAKTPTKDEFEVEFDRNDKGKAALLHGIFPGFSSACLTPGSDARLYCQTQSVTQNRKRGGWTTEGRQFSSAHASKSGP